MRLDPSGHSARGRDGFLIHGDNQALNRSASQGCIVLGLGLRKLIAASTDKDLNVT